MDTHTLTIKIAGDIADLQAKMPMAERIFAGAAERINVSAASMAGGVNTGTVAIDRMGISAKQTAAALRGVPAQFTDIITSLQGGQAPLTVFLQQGGQLKDMFGGAGNAARALGGYVAGLVNPFTVAVGTAVALAVAYEQGAGESRALEKSLILSGNQAGVTAGQLMAMAASIDQVVGTQGNAAEALAIMASGARVGGDNLEQFTTTAIKFERVTGTAVEETAKKFAELRKAPLEATLKLNDSMGYLTQSTYDQIRALTEEGKTVEAALLAQLSFEKATASMAKDIEANLGLVERSWNKVNGAVKETWDSIKGIGRDAGLEGQVAAAQKMVDVRRQAASSIYARDSDRTKLSEAENQLKGYQELLKNQQLSAKYAAERSEQVRQGSEWDKLGLKYLGDATKMERDIAAAKELGLRAGKSEVEIAQRELEIRKSYEKATKKTGLSQAEREAERDAAKEQNERIRLNRQMAIEMGEEVMRANEAYQKAQSDASKENDKYIEGLDKSAEAVAAQVLKLQDEQRALALSASANITLAQAIAEVEIARLREKQAIQMSFGNDAAAQAIQREIEQRKLLAAAIDSKDAREATSKFNEDTAKAAQKFSEQLENQITEGLMRGFENGKGITENFVDTLENTFKTLVLRPIIQATVQGAFGLSGGGAGGAGGAGSNPFTGIAQLASSFEKTSLALTDFKLFSTNAAYDLGGSLTKAGFDKAGSLVTENASQIGSLANTVGRTLSYLEAASNFKDGSYGKSIGQAAGTAFFGPVGGMIGKELGSVLDRIFGGGDYVQSLGETVATVTAAKVVSLGGSGGNNDTSIGGGLNIRQTDTSDKFAGDLASAFVKAATQLGITTSGASFGAGFNNSDGGKFAVEATVGGQKYDPGQVKYTDANLALEASRAVFFALQSSELPGYLAKVFNGITASTAAQADIDAALNYAGSLKQIRDALTETRKPLQILQESVNTALASLGTSAETFKADFVAVIDQGITPDKLAQYQQLGANLDALAESSGTAAKALKDEQKAYQDKIDILTGKTTQRELDKAAALAEASDATDILINRLYELQDAAAGVAETARVAGIVSSQQTQLLNAAGRPVNAAGSRNGQALYAGSSDRVYIPKTIAELNSSLDAFAGRAYQNADASGLSEYARSLGLTAQSMQSVLDKLALDDRAAQAAFSPDDGVRGDDNARYAAMATGGGAAPQATADNFAAALASLTDKTLGLQNQLLQAQGKTVEAAAALRDAELAKFGVDGERLEQLKAQYDANEKLSAQIKEVTAAAEAAANSVKAFEGAMSGLLSNNTDLQAQLLKLQGNDAGSAQLLRDKALKALTAGVTAEDAARLVAQYDANEALKVQIEGLTKAQQDAASAADKLKSTWSGITDGLLKEVDRIRGVMAATSADSYAALESRFAIATAQARAGDLTAAGNLTSYSGQLSGAFSENAGSRTELIRMQAQLAQSLQDTAVILGAPVAPVNTPPVINTDKLEASIATLNAEITSLKSELSAIKSNTGRTVDAVNSLRDAPLVVEIEE